MLVRINYDRISFSLRKDHRNDLLAKVAAIDGIQRPALAFEGKCVLFLAANCPARYSAVTAKFKDILGRFAHRFKREHLLQFGVRIAPTKRRVPCRDITGGPERPAVLWQRIGGAGHALHASGDVGFALAAADCPCGLIYRVQTAGAKAVHRDAAGRLGKPGQQECHSGNVTIVLAGLIGAAKIDLLDFRRVHARALNDLTDDQRSHVIGPHTRECAGVAADRGTNSVNDYNVLHVGSSSLKIAR